MVEGALAGSRLARRDLEGVDLSIGQHHVRRAPHRQAQRLELSPVGGVRLPQRGRERVALLHGLRELLLDGRARVVALLGELRTLSSSEGEHLTLCGTSSEDGATFSWID